MVITTMNGLPGSWDSFIQRMCARRKGLLSADSRKRTYTQEETQLIIREKKMGATEDQDLTIQRRSL